MGGERGLRPLKSGNGGARIPCLPSPPTAPTAPRGGGSPLMVTAAKVSRPEYEVHTKRCTPQCKEIKRVSFDVHSTIMRPGRLHKVLSTIIFRSQCVYIFCYTENTGH